MQAGRTTLSKFLIEQLRAQPGDGNDQSVLAALLVDVAAAVKTIAAMTGKGALSGALGALEQHNVHGEQQLPPGRSQGSCRPLGGQERSDVGANRPALDLLANDALIASCEWGGLVAGMASEEMELPFQIHDTYERGPYLLVFDPLDGTSNTDVNVSVGTIFSVLKHEGTDVPTEQSFLQAGRRQVAAGYAIYGPATMLVVSVGRGTHGFTLDREVGNFILTHPNLRIPEDTSEFAINTSNARFWEPPVHRYVRECQAGGSGERARDFNMRWIASMVAEVHRILIRGGVFLYPRDSSDPSRPGRLRLLYEANPMSLLIEQAGGRASTGRSALLELQPESLHQRVPVILGSKNEVERIERYHNEFDEGIDRPFASPLFNERSLFRLEPEYPF